MKEVSLNFRLPEFDRKDIQIKVGKNSVAINAKKKVENKVKKKDYFHEEKSERTFHYFTTTPNVNHKKAKIGFSKGILKINVPRE